LSSGQRVYLWVWVWVWVWVWQARLFEQASHLSLLAQALLKQGLMRDVWQAGILESQLKYGVLLRI
jgi:hypothetical protein